MYIRRDSLSVRFLRYEVEKGLRAVYLDPNLQLREVSLYIVN